MRIVRSQSFDIRNECREPDPARPVACLDFGQPRERSFRCGRLSCESGLERACRTRRALTAEKPQSAPLVRFRLMSDHRSAGTQGDAPLPQAFVIHDLVKPLLADARGSEGGKRFTKNMKNWLKDTGPTTDEGPGRSRLCIARWMWNPFRAGLPLGSRRSGRVRSPGMTSF